MKKSKQNTPKQWLFIALVAYWAVLIFGVVAYYQTIVNAGTLVELEVQPVDPTDILRGEYVVLNYAINQVPADLVDEFVWYQSKGSEVFVVLDPTQGFKVPQSLTIHRPTNGELYIKGTLVEKPSRALQFVRVRYGVENFFVERGIGKLIERHQGTALVAQIKIDVKGKAVLIGLTVNGVPAEEYFKTQISK